MSHFHYCDVCGVEWQCSGRALRPDAGDVTPSICVCVCGIPVEEGTHPECPVELLTCPLHAEQRGDQHGESLSGVNLFADSLQIMMDNAGIVDGCTWTEGKR
jgi:hypothetical protein